MHDGLAARQRAAGRPILIIASGFGQPGTMQIMLPAALKASKQLVLALDSALHLPTRQEPGHPPGHGPYKPKGLSPMKGSLHERPDGHWRWPGTGTATALRCAGVDR
jgi:hypothetical protein